MAGASDFILQGGGGVEYLEGVKDELVVCPIDAVLKRLCHGIVIVLVFWG